MSSWAASSRTLVFARLQAGKTALHWAAQFGEAQLLHELMRTADDVNQRDEAGNTPLHLAALNGHLCASTVLLYPSLNLTDCWTAITLNLHLGWDAALCPAAHAHENLPARQQLLTGPGAPEGAHARISSVPSLEPHRLERAQGLRAAAADVRRRLAGVQPRRQPALRPEQLAQSGLDRAGARHAVAHVSAGAPRREPHPANRLFASNEGPAASHGAPMTARGLLLALTLHPCRTAPQGCFQVLLAELSTSHAMQA